MAAFNLGKIKAELDKATLQEKEEALQFVSDVVAAALLDAHKKAQEEAEYLKQRIDRINASRQ